MTEARRPNARRETLAGAFLLAVVAAAAFWPVVAGARSFFHDDLYFEHLPIWAATQRALNAGTSPFWLDGEYCGQPTLMLGEAPILYPATVPLLRSGMRVHRAADVFSLFHFWLAGFATFLLVRELTGRASAGLFAGVAWMLSARMVQSALWPNAVAASALVPLGLYGLALIARGAARRGVLVAALSGGLALLTSRPHVLLAAAPLAAALAAALAWGSGDRRKTLAAFAAAAAIAAGIGAPAVLPTAALMPETSRASGLGANEADFQPLAHGHELDSVFLPVDGRARWPESAAWPGALVDVAVLAGIALFARRKPARTGRAAFWASAAGAALGLALAFGDAGPYRLVSGLPILRSLRVPERFLLSWSLGLAICAGLALAAALPRSRSSAAWGAAAVAALALELAWHARVAAPTADAAVYDVEPAVAAGLRSLGADALGFPRRYLSRAETINPVPYDDPGRLVILRHYEGLSLGLGMRWGLECAGGYGPTLARTAEYLSALTPETLRLSGVGAVVTSAAREPGEPSNTPRRIEVEPFDGLPRALLVPAAAIVPPSTALAALRSRGFDPARVALLESGEPLPADSGWAVSPGRIALVARETGRLALDATLPAPGVLVLFDAWESGWRASVDGRPAELERADFAFRGIRLGAGSHRVELAYRPRALREGAGLAVAALLALALVLRRVHDGPHGPASAL